ncbi:UNVERIFIED_CONTAM: hypothetical protein Sindi_3020100 [Sesamum indicum]
MASFISEVGTFSTAPPTKWDKDAKKPDPSWQDRLVVEKKMNWKRASECQNQRVNRTAILTHRQLQPCSYIPPRSGTGNSRLFLVFQETKAAPKEDTISSKGTAGIST